jgi:hypothetical protein
MNQAMRQITVLNNNNLSYYDFGIIKQGKKKLFNYYKVDKITLEQKQSLEHAGCVIKGCSPQYAPEIKSVLICFPKGY